MGFSGLLSTHLVWSEELPIDSSSVEGMIIVQLRCKVIRDAYIIYIPRNLG